MFYKKNTVTMTSHTILLVNAEIGTQPVTVEARTSKCSA